MKVGRICAIGIAISFLVPFGNAIVLGEIPEIFTYQGQLKDAGIPVTDNCDMRFKLRTDPIGTDNTDVISTVVFDGSDPALPPVTVQNGLFEVALDFGPGALPPTPVWLDVAIRCPSGSLDPFVGLLPRQQITAAPYAVRTRGLYVDDVGQLGIGTQSPSEALHVNGNVRAGNTTVGSTSTNGQGLTMRWMEFQTFPNPPEPRAADITYDGTQLKLLTGTSTGDPAPTNGLIIDNLGRVGIGTTALDTKLVVAGTIHVTSGGIMFPNGSVQSSAASGTGSLWQPNGSNIYYSGGQVGIGTNAPKQAIHNTGDYYGRGHLWLYAYQGDGQSGTAYVQARDDSGTSSIGMNIRTQNAGALVDALTLSPTGGVAVGAPAPASGFWVRGYGLPGFGGQVVIDSTDTSGVLDSGASIHFTNFSTNPGTYMGALSCFKEDGDPTRAGYYLSFDTRANNNPPQERMRISSTGNVGIGTMSPAGQLALGDYLGGTGTSQVETYQKQLVLGGDFNVSTNTGDSVKLLITTYDNDSPSDIYPIYVEDENNGVDFYVRNHSGIRTAYFSGMLGLGTNPLSFNTRYRMDVTSNGQTGHDDWAAHFKDKNGTGEVWLAGDDGFGRDYGIETRGSKAGGFFHDTNTSAQARVAYTDGAGRKFGIWASGNTAGGYFEDPLFGGNAYVGFADTGISADGDFAGGTFRDTNDGLTVSIAEGIYSIFGVGVKAFVENHPYDKRRVIAYAAPEGDEVATYTRGSARLINGEARVALGETFKWVTNPDIGLTVHLTPRGNCAGLYAASVSTSQIVVRELNGGVSNVAFDYIVYGLRIGFEEVAVVQEKRQEARIPSMRLQRERYAKYPELKKFTALERFKKMERSMGNVAAIDFSASHTMRDAITEFDPAIHTLARNLDRLYVAGTRKVLDARNSTVTNATSTLDTSIKSIDTPHKRYSRKADQQAQIARLQERLEKMESMLAELTDVSNGGVR